VGTRRDAGLLSNWKGAHGYLTNAKTELKSKLASLRSQCELTGGWRAVVMEPFEMEHRNWFQVRNAPKHLWGWRSHLRYSGRGDPFESIVVETLAVLDLQTGLNDCLARNDLRERGRGNTN
jgi:hypothetical protein